LKEECWRMRKVHEDKLKEFELEWITSKRRLNIPPVGDSTSSSDDDAASDLENKRPASSSPVVAIVTSSDKSASSSSNAAEMILQPNRNITSTGQNSDGGIGKSLEAMCLPDLNVEEQNKAKVYIKNFTCLSPKSRKLKKEIKRMKKLTLNSLREKESNVDDVAYCFRGSVTVNMTHQDRIGQDMALSVEGMKKFSW